MENKIENGRFVVEDVPGEFDSNAARLFEEALTTFETDVRNRGLGETRKEHPLTAEEVVEGRESFRLPL